MNKYCIRLLIIIIIISHGTAFADEEFVKTDEPGYISSDYVRLRKEPIVKDKNIVGIYRKGSRIRIYGHTINKTKIGDKEDYWYKVGSGNTDGWVYGPFIKTGNYNLASYLKTLQVPPATNNFKNIKETYWTDCDPEEKGERGCRTVIIGENYIQFSLIECYVYLIKTIKDNNNEISIDCELILSLDPVLDPNEKKLVTIKLNNNPDKITINNEKYFKEHKYKYEILGY